jgi:hypothetical protein
MRYEIINYHIKKLLDKLKIKAKVEKKPKGNE